MRKTNCILLLSLLLALPMAARDYVNLNFGWTFEAADGTRTSVNLPHDFQISQPWVAPSPEERPNTSDIAANIKSRLSPRAFKEMGTGTYYKTLNIPSELKGRRVLLDFEGIMLTGEVFLNGEHIGGTHYGYLGFECDVTDKLRYGEDNELKVVADTGEPLNSRWYTGGGLYRDVNMVITDKDLYFNRHGLYVTTPQIGKDKALVSITADIVFGARNNNVRTRVEICDPSGKIVASSDEALDFKAKWPNREYKLPDIVVANPELWDCENPNLYTATVTLVREDGTEADRLSQTFGIRTIEFSPEFGFKLNGKKVLLKGIANHHTLGALGAAAYPRAIEKRIQLIKEFGFNHIRTAHNPYSDDFLNLCDRYGIIVVDELYDKWLTQYAGGKKEWTEQWQSDIYEWIRRDRNHPCVVIWSLGNELQGYSNMAYNDWGVTAYRLQKTLLDRYDTTRPVTVAMHPRFRDIETDSLPAPLVHETDIASYNYRYMYFPGDARNFPGLMFYQSEANMSNMGPNFYIPNVRNDVLGSAYWGMIDYLGESQGWPNKGFANGVFDISLTPKPNAWFLKAMFTDEAVVRIGVVTPREVVEEWNGVKMPSNAILDCWNFHKGDSFKIYVYTNADEISLRVNGREVGRQINDKNDPRKRSRVVFEDVKYVPGKIEAVAFNGGKEVARHSIETAGEAKRLVAEIDNPEFIADGMDLQHIRVYAVDSRGRRSPMASEKLHFEIEGNGELVAVTNGDIASDELHVGNERCLYFGSAEAIVRATRTAGPVKLTITSEKYKPVSVTFSSKEQF